MSLQASRVQAAEFLQSLSPDRPNGDHGDVGKCAKEDPEGGHLDQPVLKRRELSYRVGWVVMGVGVPLV
jgi:hypothetical protein